MLQCYAVQKFHGNERLLAVLADFVDGANVRMIEGRGRASLAAEALQRLWITRHFIGKEFEGDETAEVGVFGLVDDSHASAAEFIDDAVVRDRLAYHQAQILRWRSKRVNERAWSRRWLNWTSALHPISLKNLNAVAC